MASRDSETPEWAPNSKTIHAWRNWRGRDGRLWGYRALCGVTSRYEFSWSMRITDPGAEGDARRCNPTTPMCATCRDHVHAVLTK